MENWDLIIANMEKVVKNESAPLKTKTRASLAIASIYQTKLNNTVKAKEYYEYCLEIAPDHPMKDSIKKQLSSL